MPFTPLFIRLCALISFVYLIASPSIATELEISDSLVTIQLLNGDTSLASAIAIATTCGYLSVAQDPLPLGAGFFEFKMEVAGALDSVQDDLFGVVQRVNPVIERAGGRRAWLTDRLIAMFKSNVSFDSLDAIESVIGCKRESNVPDVFGFISIRSDSAFGQTITELCELYASFGVCSLIVPEVVCPIVFHDTLEECSAAPNDRAPRQWMLDNRGQSGGTLGVDINAPHAWRATKGSPDVTVAVIDGSFDWDEQNIQLHNDIAFLDTTLHHSPRGRDPVGGDVFNPVLDSNPRLPWCRDSVSLDQINRGICTHGTACLGVMAAAHNGYSIDGIAPRCSFYALKAVDDELRMRDTGFAATLGYALELGADVISISITPNELLGLFPRTEACLRILKDSGVVVFYAAGNDSGAVLYPANLGTVYAVGATDHNDSLFPYSCRDSTLDFVAPSGPVGDSCPFPGNIVSWDLQGAPGLAGFQNCDTAGECSNDLGTFCGNGGTSLATPVAAGVAALILSLRSDLLDSLDPGQAVIDIMKASCVDLGEEGRDTLYGYGRVDAGRALAYAALPNDPYPDGVHSILDVFEVINVAFRGRGCLPLYYAAGDLNCDDAIDVLDVTAMINVAFRGESPASVGFVPCKDDLGGPACCLPPSLVTPYNDTTNLPYSFMLTASNCYWADFYLFEVDTSRWFAEPIISDTSVTPCNEIFGLSQDTKYYWRVSSWSSDCPMATSSIRTFTIGPSSPAFAVIPNSITVESANFTCGEDSLSLGIYISNAVPLSALVVPLEIRTVSGGGYLGAPSGISTSNRLTNRLSSYSPVMSFLPYKDASGVACGGVGYSTRVDFEEPDLVSPDALLYIGIADEDAQLLPVGSDGESPEGDPSLWITFHPGNFKGTFEIDTTCISPANHLLFVDGQDTWSTTVIVPDFVKGSVTIEGVSVLSGSVIEHDTLACHVSLIGDVTIDSGASLTILPGRTVQALSFHDTTSGGLDPDLVEIIVYGELTLGDSAGAAPLLAGDSAMPGAWYGIRVMPGGRLNVGSGAVIQNAVVGITLDSLADVDSLTRLEISNCDVAGIWIFGPSAVIANNLIYDIPEGYGISVWDADPLIIGNTITNCETGIDVLRSSSQVRGNVINGPGMHGIFISHYDEMYPGQDTLRVIDNEILGYFSAAHLYAGGFGHCRVDSCEFISQYVSGAQSPYGVKVAQGAWTKIRRTKIQAFGSAGVYSYKSNTNLGKTKDNNGGVDDLGFNVIHTDSAVGCEEICFTKCVSHVGLTSTDTLRAEGNWWDSVPPPPFWFSTLVDRTPYLEEDPLGKLVADQPVAADVPRSTSLGQNYPNPFNPSTTVSFSIAVRTKVRLVIYNTLGQQVSVLADRDYEPGQHALTWDGRDESGNQVASGIYFYRLTAGDFVESKKMVLLK